MKTRAAGQWYAYMCDGALRVSMELDGPPNRVLKALTSLYQPGNKGFSLLCGKLLNQSLLSSPEHFIARYISFQSLLLTRLGYKLFHRHWMGTIKWWSFNSLFMIPISSRLSPHCVSHAILSLLLLLWIYQWKASEPRHKTCFHGCELELKMDSHRRICWLANNTSCPAKIF